MKGAFRHKAGWFRRLTATALVVWAIFAAAPAGAFSLSGLKNRMVDFLLEQISTPGAFEVKAESVEDAADGATSLVGVTVSDAEGVWLTIESAGFSWNPSRLLRGEVEIDSLTISGLSMTRNPTPLPEEEAPEPEEDEGGFSFDWPRSPITLRVQRVLLERIHLAEGVAPQEIRFDGSGGARDEAEIQALQLSIRRIDEIEGVIDLDYERNFDTDHLRFKLTAREAAGGIVAAAAGLPTDAASRVTLNADGPPEDWRVALDAHVDRMADVVGEARISYAGPLSAVADFSFTPGPDLGEAARVAFSPAATLKVDAGEGEDGRLDIRAAEIASPALSLVADGSLNRRDGSMDLGVRLSVERAMAGLAEGVDFARIGFDGKALGAPADLTLSGDFQIEELATAPADVANLALNAEVRKTGERIAITGVGQADGLRLDQVRPETLGPAQLTLDAALEGDIASLAALKLDSGALSVAVEGGADLAAETLEVGYRVTAPDLAPVAASYGAEAAGVFSATGAASGTFAAPRVDGEFSLTGARVADRNLGALTVSHRIALDEALRADVTAAFRGSDFGDADLVADAVLEGDALEARYMLTAPDLSPAGEALGAPLAGALTAEGAAKGLLSALSLTGETRIAGASAAGTGLGDVTLSHAVALGEGISGDLALALDGSDYGDAKVSTGFALAGETLTVEGLTADALGLTAEGGATVDLASTATEGGVRVSGGLGGLGRLTGAKMGGALRADLSLTAPQGRQAAALKATVANLQTDGAAVETISLTAEGRDLLGQPALTADLAVAGADAGDLELQTFDVTADGPLSALAVALNAVGEMNGDDLSAEAEALVDASGPETRVTVSNLTATLAEERVTLASIMTVTAGRGTTRIEGLDLSLPDDGRLAGEAALHPNGASGDIQLTGFTMATMKRLGLNVFDEGATDLSARFDTRAGPAGAEITLTGRGYSTRGALRQAGRALDLDATALWDGRTLNADVRMVGPAGRPLTARAALPLRPTGQLLPAPPRGAEIDAAIDWSGEIANIWSLVPATGHILRGDTDIALTVTGRIDQPRIGGRLKISDGVYENLDLGTILTELDVETTIAEGRDIGLNLSASDGAGGRVEGTASVALSGVNEGLDVKISTQSATLVRRDDVTARVHGDVAVTGPLNDILVKGEIEIQGAEVRLVNSSPPGVATLGEVQIKGEETDGREEAEPSLVTLDMRIFAERRIFVRGRGLDSEWRADIKIDGSASDPQIVGSVERVRGGLDLLGKNFELERGAAIFTGSADPELDVMLTRETNDFIGRIVVSRTASDPAISFTSDPVVPEEEVLPQAIFGRSSQSLSAAQGIQLALGVATLMDGGDGTLGDIRGALGVDVLSLDTDDDGEQEVNVGSYVADGVYVGAKQSLGGGSSVVVEIDILDNVTVDVETGASTGESVGLNWKYDF